MSGPLTSLRVLDFTTMLPGPFATMVLADMGASVLRIEAPGRPDIVRSLPPFAGETSAWHSVLNRSKRSLALDLKKPGAAAIVQRLVTAGGYDILIEQFRPGVMDRLGVGYEALQAHQPALIYCAITGYGQSGPLRDRAGHDINYLALSGAVSYSGPAGSGPPPLGIQVADVGGGSLGALVGLLAAVIHRQVSGQGQFVDISMTDMMLAWQAHLISEFLVAGQLPQREAMPLNGGSFYGFYETADGRYLAVGSLEPHFWQGFCQAIGRPDLADGGYSLSRARQAALKEALQAAIRTRPLAAWIEVFAALDLCVEPVLNVAEVVDSRLVAERQMVVEVPIRNGERQRQIGSPFRFEHSQATYRHAGVAAGAHTDEVLREIGYNEGDIAAFRAAGLFGN